jgi:curved DNA-binding protein CbpA
MMDRSGKLDHYRLLGVAHDASAREIRRAYRRLARQHHPDLNPRADGAERFAAFAHAYEILNDPAARARYDDTLAPRVPIARPAATRDTPRSPQPADQPIALWGILELSPHEAEHLTRSPLSLTDPSGQTIALPAGIAHGDEITLLYHRRAVLLKVRVRGRG